MMYLRATGFKVPHGVTPERVTEVSAVALGDWIIQTAGR